MTARDIVMSAAGNAGSGKTYIEDVFSTYLYTGNGSTQTINNGIDLAGKGGMVWIKNRNEGVEHSLFDTQRGINKLLSSNLTDAQFSLGNVLTPLSTGFYFDSDAQYYPTLLNGSNKKFASWTFRKAPKFFDVVTWTGDGVAGRVVPHSLASQPGFIIIKKTSDVRNWFVAASDGNGNYKYLWLNSTSAELQSTTQSNVASSSGINVGWINSNWEAVNASGQTFVAYLFAHDTTTDGLIQCGSFSGAATVDVNLGWEPQYVLFKNASSGGSWFIADVMRGMSNTRMYPLQANTSDAEFDLGGAGIIPTATGFTFKGANFGYTSGQDIIYMAIRRGPMKTPTDGTKVFSPVAYTGDATSKTITSGFPVDTFITIDRNNSSSLYPNYKPSLFDRILGNANGFVTSSTAAWGGGWGDTYFKFDSNTGIPITGNYAYLNNSSTPYIDYFFQRAPGFFDVVCYTGTGVARTVNHNLGVAPELMIVKKRSGVSSWFVYCKYFNGGVNPEQWYAIMNNTDAAASGVTGLWNDTAPTSTVFTVGDNGNVNGSGATEVAYLFASCPGVSKVGSYTGTGSAQNINCGFTNGARFVLIKETTVDGAWYVFDTARGITSGNDARLTLNGTGAESTSSNYLDPYSGGFSVPATGLNSVGVTHIYLAIA